jgi:hypothetical protein
MIMGGGEKSVPVVVQAAKPSGEEGIVALQEVSSQLVDHHVHDQLRPFLEAAVAGRRYQQEEEEGKSKRRFQKSHVVPEPSVDWSAFKAIFVPAQQSREGPGPFERWKT